MAAALFDDVPEIFRGGKSKGANPGPASGFTPLQSTFPQSVDGPVYPGCSPRITRDEASPLLE